jgi:hypothetical protein
VTIVKLEVDEQLFLPINAGGVEKAVAVGMIASRRNDSFIVKNGVVVVVVVLGLFVTCQQQQ